ncbi:MAG: tetratricopeptide repeat protein [Myxococcales bacterium]|nr:tetratricopeptide repeat protein [Myxococcales bacterium]MDH3484531.1 tetratricopeptide repeat protein [Myxococcales bacterium]
MRACAALHFALALTTVGLWACHASADDMADPLLLEGEEASPEEVLLWDLVQRQRYVKARDAAEKFLVEHPSSYVGHLVFAEAQHYGEANFPKALFHETRALELFEARHGASPVPSQPWRWHARILIALTMTHGNLEHYDEQLDFMRQYNELYTPQLKAELAWPLMKKRQFAAARIAAEEGLATGDPYQIERAKNALCAVEFEAGDDAESYEACRDAVEYARSQFGSATAVDLGNYAEAARSIFRFDEAERLLMEASRSGLSWYGNPWLELADLYMRAGRFAESLSALREVPRHRAARPAHVRDSDRNEARRSLAAFLLLMGRPDEALRITDKAVVLPDRRAHNSRDPEQDRSVVALLDRQARLMLAEMTIERAVAKPFHRRWWAHANAAWLRFQAWMSARQAARFLDDDSRLVGTFAIGTARSAVMPPWLTGELIPVLGPGVVRAAIVRVRSTDSREGASAYYDAVLAEVALVQGRYDDAIEHAEGALEGLQPGDALLRERVRAVLASSLSDPRQTATLYEQVLGSDPGLFRRLGWALPVRVESSGSEIDREVAKALRRSPRFEPSDDGLRIQVQGGQACLFGRTSTSWGCSQVELEENETGSAYRQRVVDSFHQTIFSPRVDLSRIDINSLDGSNRVTRNPLDTLLEP